MQLYGVPGWGSAITEAMLAFANLDYTFTDVSGFDKPGVAKAQLSAINALNQVPSLVLNDGTVMTETAAIALFLSEQNTNLAPAIGSPERASFLRLLIWLVTNVYQTFTYGDYPERWVEMGRDELVMSTDRHREALYRWLETQAVEPFILGEAASALDIYLAVMVHWRPRFAWFEQNTPKLARIAQRTRRLPGIESVLTRNNLS